MSIMPGNESAQRRFEWKQFSRKAWVIAICGLIFPPLGIVLTWLKPGWSNRTKWIATAVLALMLIARMKAKQTAPDSEESPVATLQDVEVDSHSHDSRVGRSRDSSVATATQDSRSSQKPSIDNHYITEWPAIKTSRKQPVDMTKVFEISMGMTADTVRNVLGEPHEIVRGIIKETPVTQERDTARWTYRGKIGDDFIMVGMTNGVVDSGGAAGWDFAKGFDDFAEVDDRKRMIQHYMAYLKRGGKPPFGMNHPPR
jgi:hypothetical protein